MKHLLKCVRALINLLKVLVGPANGLGCKFEVTDLILLNSKSNSRPSDGKSFSLGSGSAPQESAAITFSFFTFPFLTSLLLLLILPPLL